MFKQFIQNLFKRDTKQPGYKIDPTSNTWEAKKQRDMLTDARPLNIRDAHSWNKETHPEGEGSSYLVNNIDYDPSTKDLTVQYRDGFTAKYSDIPLETAKDFVTSSSKGRFAHQHLFNLPYEAV